MISAETSLPSWQPGRTRESVLRFLESAETLPKSQRVAAFDNDGTLWCEKPTYVQLDFFIDALKSALAHDPALAERVEYAALLTNDRAAMGELGLERIALALGELFLGLMPEEFADRAREFMGRAQHHTLGVPLPRIVYQPMLELLDELRQRDFTIFIVSGGGTEFVRAISDDLYEVPANHVVGTLIEYEFSRTDDGHPQLLRTARVEGAANEGAAKVANIQSHLGRRPILAVGNSGGDREMLEWACAGGEPCLAMLVNHDDAEREFAYVSKAETFAEAEAITDVAERLGWTVISMANDWSAVFPAE